MAAPGMIEIALEDYERLVSDQNPLEALRGAGVDNWEGWGDAVDSINNGEDE